MHIPISGAVTLLIFISHLGKYKSFGDTFNRLNISDAQREVVSSLLTEASNYWIDAVAMRRNKSLMAVCELWGDKSNVSSCTPYELKKLGFVDNVLYLDQVETFLQQQYSRQTHRQWYNPLTWFTSSSVSNVIEKTELVDFDLSSDFAAQPRRSKIAKHASINSSDVSNVDSKQRLSDSMQVSCQNSSVPVLQAKSAFNTVKPQIYPALRYLRKMRKGSRILQGLRIREVRGGSRVAVINAVGGINTGKSSSGATGRTLGSDSLIALLRQVRDDHGIKAVVLRVDSPGGSALASDLMWREIRELSRTKPVVASLVDVAASGGYYLSMACDCIVSDTLSVTGSIGVVLSKFSAERLNDKLGLHSDTISRGKYAEVDYFDISRLIF